MPRRVAVAAAKVNVVVGTPNCCQVHARSRERLDVGEGEPETMDLADVRSAVRDTVLAPNIIPSPRIMPVRYPRMVVRVLRAARRSSVARGRAAPNPMSVLLQWSGTAAASAPLIAPVTCFQPRSREESMVATRDEFAVPSARVTRYAGFRVDHFASTVDGDVAAVAP